MSTFRETAAVFVEGYLIEKSGHVAHLWSNAERVSYADCSCSWRGTAEDCHVVMEQWRAHVSGSAAGGSL